MHWVRLILVAVLITTLGWMGLVVVVALYVLVGCLRKGGKK